MWVVKSIYWQNDNNGIDVGRSVPVFTWQDFNENNLGYPRFTLWNSDTGEIVRQVCHNPEEVAAFMCRYMPYGFIKSGDVDTWAWSHFVIAVDDQSWQLLDYVDKVSYVEVESRFSSPYSRYVVDTIEFIGLDRNATFFTGYVREKEFYCTLFQAIEHFRIGRCGNDYVLCGGRRYDEHDLNDPGVDVVYYVKVFDPDNFNRLLTKAHTIYKNPILSQLALWGS